MLPVFKAESEYTFPSLPDPGPTFTMSSEQPQDNDKLPLVSMDIEMVNAE
jgi:hypothetical protein